MDERREEEILKAILRLIESQRRLRPLRGGLSIHANKDGSMNARPLTEKELDKMEHVHVGVTPPDRIVSDPRDMELLKASQSFIDSFKAETIERFMKEHFYGQKKAYHVAERLGIRVIPYIIELVSHIGDAPRTANNMNHYFNEMSNEEKMHTIAILASIAFAAMARASGHEDWSSDVYRKKKE